MDEFGSPISGGIRAIRRNLSSSFLGAPRQPQADPVTTNLLQQQSLQLTSVSGQLQNISKQVSSLDFNLKSVKENLALNEQLEKQREAAKQNRERILAEQGLREGKESQLEKKIQSSLSQPVEKIGVKTQGILNRLTTFLFTLAGGWLTVTGIDLLQSLSEGNVDKINKLKTKFVVGLTVILGSFTAIQIGIKKVIGILGVFAGNVARVAFGGILKASLRGVQFLLGGLVKKAAGLGLGFFGAAGIKSIIGQIVATVVGIKLGKFIPGFNKIKNLNKVKIAPPVLKSVPKRNLLPNVIKNINKKFSPVSTRALVTSGGAGVGGGAVVTSSGGQFVQGSQKVISKKFSSTISSKVTTGTGKEVVKKSGFLSKLKGFKNLGGAKLLGKILNAFGPVVTFFSELLSEDGGLVSAFAATGGFMAGAKIGAVVGGSLGALIAGVGSAPGAVIGALIGGFIGETAIKALAKKIMSALGFKDIKVFGKDKSNLSDEDFTPTTEGANNITPTKNDNLNVADQISEFDEDASQVINLNNNNQNNQSAGMQGDPSSESGDLPTISFDDSNPYTLYTTALTGVSG